jgi:2-oxoglutarate dehydrogenase E2 component (dihydrolipoamide succinyltransferase)
MSIVTEPLESLGDSITTAVLLSWSKEPGDPIKEDDVIAIVETDKVTMDIRAKQSGTFLEALCEDGAEISVGVALYKMDTSAVASVPINAEATLNNTTPPPNNSAAPATEKFTVEVPIMGESITTGTIALWNFKTGDFVGMDEVVAMIETDKVNVEVRSPYSGVLVETFNEEGDEVEVGQPMFVLEQKEAPEAGKAEPAPAETKAKSAAVHVPAAVQAPVKATPAAPFKPAAPVDNAHRSETRVKITRMRLRIAQRLKEAQNTAAMLTTFQEVDMGHLIDLRKKHKEEFEKIHGVKLGFMSAFVRAATTTLQEIPAVNAVIDDATKEIVYRNYVDISVAVASPNGLVVPVLRNCEKMGFADVEKQIGAYGAKAKAGALALEDMAGGTFTISNGGVFGSLFGTPIINPPQSAILGMHATKMRAMVMPNGEIKARPMMYLALTYDHRLVDGREAVTFLKSIQAKIEDPARLLLSI